MDGVASAARGAIDKLLAAAGTKDAMSNGAPTIDMSGLDRRSLFAVASNQGGGFSAGEQAVAAYTMAGNFANALAGPVSASHITGDYAAIYKAGLAYLDKAGPEEKATAAWTSTARRPDQGPAGGDLEPRRPARGHSQRSGRGLCDGACRRDPDDDQPRHSQGGRRRALLCWTPNTPAPPDGQADAIDLSSFDDRALAAMALDKGDQFSSREIAAAKAEIRTGPRAACRAMRRTAGPTHSSALGSDLITRYPA